MKLNIFDNQQENVFHLLHTFNDDYEGMPLHQSRIVGQSLKTEPFQVNSLAVETLTVFIINNKNYSLETRIAICMYALAEAQESIKWSPTDSHKMIDDEILDVAVGLQRVLLNRMNELDLLTTEQLEAFHTWDCITPSGLLTELEYDVDDFNPIHTSYFVANSVYKELSEWFKKRIKC